MWYNYRINKVKEDNFKIDVEVHCKNCDYKNNYKLQNIKVLTYILEKLNFYKCPRCSNEFN